MPRILAREFQDTGSERMLLKDCRRNKRAKRSRASAQLCGAVLGGNPEWEHSRGINALQKVTFTVGAELDCLGSHRR